MHRLSKDFVIQGGGFYPFFLNEPPPINVSLDPDAQVDLDGNPLTPNPTIINEFGNSPFRSNLRGTIAMARKAGLPNSADTQWFVNLVNNTGLDIIDGGFTVFARVTGDGMSVFDALNTLAITNLNPDYDDNGTRDNGPFYLAPGDGVPVLGGNLVTLEKAQHIDYLGAGLITDVPANGLNFATRNAFIDTGAVFTGTGPLAIGNGRTLGVREGTTLARTLVNRGTLAPGLQLGAITVDTYQQFFDGALEIQLRETTPDTQHDQLNVTNIAYLSGELKVSLLNNFAPAAGDSFTVLNAGLVIGGFTSVELPQLVPGLVWDVNESLTGVTLAVALADYNRNGVADAADYVLWRNSRNTSVPPSTGADGNGDGLVNDLDFALWRSHFGNHNGTAGGAGGFLSHPAPEPATIFFALSAGLLLAAGRRISRPAAN
jgi:cyclophilin family peptidyl-prolyl cis-trans isomerase